MTLVVSDIDTFIDSEPMHNLDRPHLPIFVGVYDRLACPKQI